MWNLRNYSLKCREFLKNEKKSTWGTLGTLSQVPIETSLKVVENLNNVRLLEQWGEPTSIMAIPKEQEHLRIFGKDVLLPKLYRSLTKVKPEIHSPLTDIKPGEEIIVRWIPETR